MNAAIDSNNDRAAIAAKNRTGNRLHRVITAKTASEAETAIGYLRSPLAIRARCENILEAAFAGELQHFAVEMTAMPKVIDEVVAVTRANYPTTAFMPWPRSPSKGPGSIPGNFRRTMSGPRSIPANRHSVICNYWCLRFSRLRRQIASNSQ